MHATSAESTCDHQEHFNMMFTKHSKEDAIYPLTVKEIAQAQKDNAAPKKLHNHEKYSTQLVEDTQLLYMDGKMLIPPILQNHTVSWYHHYLQHPGLIHLEERLHVVM